MASTCRPGHCQLRLTTSNRGATATAAANTSRLRVSRGPGRPGPGPGQEPGRQGQAEAGDQGQGQVGEAAHQEKLQQHDPQGRAQGLQIVGPPRRLLGSRRRQNLDRAGEKEAGNQSHGGQQQQKEQEGGGKGQGLAQGQVRQAGHGPARQDGGGQQQPQQGQQTAQPSRPHLVGVEAASRQAAHPGPQEPAPQPQGQLQFLPLGQNQQLPKDQNLSDHGPGPENQDDALDSA